MPHLLIAGQTGSGKSVMINTLLTSLLYRNSPSDLKLILVDPKQVEMALYHDIPHLLSPVITEPEKCISALKWAVAEMERRLKAFSEVGKRNIAEYNKVKQEEGMPYIVIVIDELADLMMMAARDVEALIVRLAQKARAAGIHLVVATQRPSVDVITGLIKANIPARIAFTVVSQVDSRTIIDQAGAEKLLGRGDLLYSIPEYTKPKRVQGALISDTETNKICDFLRAQRPPSYNEEVISQPVQIGKGGVVASMDGDEDDDMMKDAVAVVINTGKASTSLLQRKLRIGYGRASRLIDVMEEQGIVGPADGAKPRQVLVNSIDDVFGGQQEAEAMQSQPVPVAVADDGDVYDDMPDDEQA
jgi:S-DNA-T family DNA segregation ATPase FtsK/SpoIIIE